MFFQRAVGTSHAVFFFLALGGGVAISSPSLAQAPNIGQSTIFCPINVGGNVGFGQISNLCTDTIHGGAFSSAALASQAIGDVQQSTTQQATSATMDAISARRAEEANRRDPAPQRRASELEPARQSASHRTAQRRGAAHRVESVRPLKAVAPVPVYDAGPRWGVWAHGFGDYERRDNTIQTSTATMTAPSGQGLNVDLQQTARTGGMIGGVDLTFRNVLGAGDGLIVGALGGYLESDISFSTNVKPTAPIVDATVGLGFASGKVRIAGPSAGIYYTYFNGGFSNDTTFKVDFLSIRENFNEVYAFSFGYGNQQVAGAGAADVNNYVVASNFQYRFPVSSTIWLEPTAGFRYTNSQYAASAAALGLDNGEAWRLQGGLRVGFESMWNATRVTTVLTGLAYSDVSVTGGVITNGATGGAFAGTAVLPSDQGKVRGQGIARVNFDYGNGFSTFVQGEVRGGEGLFGAGGRAGVRYQF